MRNTILCTGATVAVAFSLIGCGSNSTDSAPAHATSASEVATSAPETTAVTTPPGTSRPGGSAATTTTQAAVCGVDLGGAQVQSAVAGLPPYQPSGSPGTTWQWAKNPATYEGNFDPCATLSAAIVTIEGATASSPQQILLFNKGTYLGPATPDAGAFISLDPTHTTDDTVGLTYKTPGSCNACPDGTYTPVSFHWDGSTVQMIGQPPALR
ncbi:LppP/LprE family lipoprotein [Nocardia australiensis]|uniref:LppP/LprE family lipoprotein n=1 Tax=Nocardia australiensis TaxID=2887191 RepID=UPI001D144A13|nr:LppP/LprE family lipoprotein [Nocardia australiensis]